MSTPSNPQGAGRFVPIDDDTRGVIRDALDDTLFVEASAGTGKTASLVARVVHLVAAGCATLDQVAVITFTEAAAAELRDRVRHGLEQASSDAGRGEEERARCRQGLFDLDQAAIQTLHSFASALLHERPLEAGLPPAFETTDEIGAGLRFNERWKEWLDEALEEDSPMAGDVGLALTLGMKLGQLKDLALEFHRNYADLEGAAPEAPPPDTAPSDARAKLLAEWPEAQRLCEYAKDPDADPLYAHVQGKAPAMRRLAEAEAGSLAAYRLLQQLLPLRCGKGKQADWETDATSGVNACKALKEALKEWDDAVAEEMNRARAAALTPLLEELRRFALDYAQKRRDEGRAEFHDLLVWARNLLRGNIAARDHFRRRFSHVLIDEVQDTDPIQAEIAMFLSERVPEGTPAAERPAAWEHVVPERGKLFVVGDPKQSIYRFRRADVAQMERLRERMAQADGRALSLTQNFRSHEPLVTWVNHVFERWMGGADSDGAPDAVRQPRYEAMFPRWDGGFAGGAGPRVWALGNEETEGRMEFVRRQGAREIAGLLRRVVGAPWQTLDREQTDASGRQTYRPVGYADVCILTPSRTGLDILEQALASQGVPYRLESASLIFRTQEVRDLLNCLKSIDDPSDQVASVAALRSPAFGCSDLELLRHYEARGSFDATQAQDGRGHAPVRDALETLRLFHESRLWELPGALIDRFVRERGLMEAAAGHPRMREQWRRYRFIVERAWQFASVGGSSLRAFVEWVEDQMREGARVTEAPVPESDEEAVRVMTVHASKGLEFPVVILTGLNSEVPRRNDVVIFDRARGGFEAGLGPKAQRFATLGYEEAVERERGMSDAERVRLLYVACTRARDHLIVSLRRKTQKGGSKSYAATISALLQDAPELWQPISGGAAAQAPAQAAPSEVQSETEAEHSLTARDEWAQRREALVAAMGRPSYVAATALGHPQSGGEAWESGEAAAMGQLDEEAEPDASEPWRKGRATTSLGRAVHAVLQSIDLATGEGIDERAQGQAAAEGIPGRTADVARLARAAVESGIVKRAVASGRTWREVAVAAPAGGGSLHGFIDLLFEETDGLVVVDYKTDAVSAREAPEAVARYRLQGGAYAHAIQQVTRMPVKEVVFLYLEPAREARLDDLAGAMADAASEARARLGAG